MALVSGGVGPDGYGLRIRDGAAHDHPVVRNDVNIEAVPTHTGPDIFTRHGASIVEVLVKHWAPDWVSLRTSATVDAVPGGRRRPHVGVLTWLDDVRGEVPERLSAVASVRRVGQGTLVDLFRDGQWPDLDDVLEVHRTLADAGLLEDWTDARYGVAPG